jgi:hypothetical protein
MADIRWRWPHGEVDMKVVEEIEQQLQIKFPEDYLEVARLYNGAAPSPGEYDFQSYEGKRTTNFGGLLSFHREEAD